MIICCPGSAEEGFRPPPILGLDANLTAIKVANATEYHFGVMGIWQMRGAYGDGDGGVGPRAA